MKKFTLFSLFSVFVIIFACAGFAGAASWGPFADRDSAEVFYYGNVKVEKTLQGGKIVWVASTNREEKKFTDQKIATSEEQNVSEEQEMQRNGFFEIANQISPTNILEKNTELLKEAIEYAKNPEFWDEDWSVDSTLDRYNPSFWVNEFIYRIDFKIDGAFDVYKDWFHFAVEQKYTLGMYSFFSNFHNEIRHFFPEKRKEFETFMSEILEKEWAYKNASIDKIWIKEFLGLKD